LARAVCHLPGSTSTTRQRLRAPLRAARAGETRVSMSASARPTTAPARHPASFPRGHCRPSRSRRSTEGFLVRLTITSSAPPFRSPSSRPPRLHEIALTARWPSASCASRTAPRPSQHPRHGVRGPHGLNPGRSNLQVQPPPHGAGVRISASGTGRTAWPSPPPGPLVRGFTGAVDRGWPWPEAASTTFLDLTYLRPRWSRRPRGRPYNRLSSWLTRDPDRPQRSTALFPRLAAIGAAPTIRATEPARRARVNAASASSRSGRPRASSAAPRARGSRERARLVRWALALCAAIGRGSRRARRVRDPELSPDYLTSPFPATATRPASSPRSRIWLGVSGVTSLGRRRRHARPELDAASGLSARCTTRAWGKRR